MALKTDREKTAHLLRRFGLGASESEVDYYVQGGWKSAVDKLLNYDQVAEPADITIDKFALPNPQGVPQLRIQGVVAWWHVRILTTRRPLLEKMTVFWHDHFATSASKVNVPPLMYQQNETIRSNATGKFQTLLLEMSKDPAMIFWLDNQYNVRGKANENFAREVMELFTLGIGNYSEKDIQEASRAFTGWTFRRTRRFDNPEVGRAADFLFRPGQHDADDKTVFGKTGPFGGEDIIAMLCEMPQTAKYIVTKLWEWFAYAEPAPALIEKLTTQFRESGLDIKVILRAIMESPEFYSDKAERAIYKNPVDFIIPTLRQLGLGEIVASQNFDPEQGPVARLGRVAPAAAAAQSANAMGMQLLFPPDVAGWASGPAWITTATIVERIGWADRIFGTSPPAQRRAQIRFPAYGLFAADPTPEGVVSKLVSVFDAPIQKAKIPQLVTAAKKACEGQLTRQNANQTAAAVCRLIFGSPEFQFA
ncbi:MAG: DUF1800 domain-containing protein [Fimbriimonadaceae bacterium]